MRKIMIMGTGAQGSTIAKRAQEEPSVEEILCADYDMRAAEELEKSLSKAKTQSIARRLRRQTANPAPAPNGATAGSPPPLWRLPRPGAP